MTLVNDDYYGLQDLAWYTWFCSERPHTLGKESSSQAKALYTKEEEMEFYLKAS